MIKKELEAIQGEVNSLLAEISPEAKAVVSSQEGEEEAISIQIESPEPAFLIGFHGETLQALQLIFSFLCHKKLDRWVRLIVNVGDYRQKREEQLQRLALNLAMKAKFSKEAQTIPNLNSSERRFIHLFLSDHPDVYSESEGEGRQRVLTIKPKK